MLQCAIPSESLACYWVCLAQKSSSFRGTYRTILLGCDTVLVALKKCWKQSEPLEPAVTWEHSAPGMTAPLRIIKVISNIANFLLQILLIMRYTAFSYMLQCRKSMERRNTISFFSMYCHVPYNNILEYSPHKSLHSPAQDTLLRLNNLSSQEMFS